MWSMCSISTGHCSTHAPHVVHDHSTSGSMTPNDAASPTSAHFAERFRGGRGEIQPVARDGLPVDEVGGLREEVIAQVHDHKLGGQWLSGVPCRALGLATPALSAGREVQISLPGEVLDLPSTKRCVLAQVLHIGEVDRCALLIGRGQQRTHPVGQPLRRHVQRGNRDVQVFGVDDDDRESEDHRHLRQQEERLDTLVVGAVAEQLRDRVRGERRLRRAEREMPRVVLCPAIQQQGHDNQGDHAQDHPGRSGV